MKRQKNNLRIICQKKDDKLVSATEVGKIPFLMYVNRAECNVYRHLKDSVTLEETKCLTKITWIKIIQVKGVIVENMMERKQIT